MLSVFVCACWFLKSRCITLVYDLGVFVFSVRFFCGVICVFGCASCILKLRFITLVYVLGLLFV